MKNKLILVLIISFVIYFSFVLSNPGPEIINPEYQTYIKEYRESINQKLEEYGNSEEENFRLQYKAGKSSGTTGNFEGPQVHIKGIKFHDEFLTTQHLGSRLKHMDGVSAHFDPDHTYYGLPDVKISVKDVRLYNPHKSSVADFLSFKSKRTGALQDLQKENSK